VPARNAGVFASFQLHKQRQATVTAKLPSGKYVPAGAEAFVAGTKYQAEVADSGLIYFSDLALHNHIVVRWGNGSCQFNVDYPDKTKSPLPNLRVHVCQPITGTSNESN
jgi:outer membrane usher protein FimD/PapC